ncbi:hypothetical protein QBC43DRAFT_382280 [Cladorrhinum sp. PSN259]|nr:hypothetical protein QBC43DRAFT_382280 [Cladorrhinum sp. PSN259]
MGEFSTEAFTLLGFGLCTIAFRLYARISMLGLRGLHPDDYLMALAAVPYIIETYLAYTVGAFWKGFANNGMTDEERRLLDPTSDEYRFRQNGSKTQVAGWSIYIFLLWTLKSAMCSFYLRLTNGLVYKRRIYAGFIIIFVTGVVVLLSLLLTCSPLKKNWQIYPNPGDFCQPATSKVNIFVTLTLNVTTDFYLMSIGTQILSKVSAKPLKKAGLMLLFSGGIFIMVAGILRGTLILTDPINGAQQSGSWAVRESFVAVVTSNLPMIYPFVARWVRQIIGTIQYLLSQATGRSKKNSLGGGEGTEQGFNLENTNPRRGMGPRSVNPLTTCTFNNSDTETHICIEDRDTAIIIQETSVEVIEMRKSPFPKEEEDVGDYYLVHQPRITEEMLGKTAANKTRPEIDNISHLSA